MSSSTGPTDLAELLADCVDDPGLFHEAILGRVPFHAKQEAIARSVLTNRVTVVPAAHSVGKTWAAPSSIWHWLCTRPGSKVVTTSPSLNQLVTALWGGIKSAKQRSLVPLPGVITGGESGTQRLTIGHDHYAIGFCARKPESFQGIHPDGTVSGNDGDILVVADESSGIDQPIWDAIESLGYTSLLALGNPLRASGHFKALWDQCEAGAPGYAGFHLSAFDSPYADLTDDDVRARGLPKGLATRTWIENTRRLYGESSLYWITRVLARFPDHDTDRLIPAEWLDACTKLIRSGSGPRHLIVDIAKGTGRDRTVILVADYFGVLFVWQDNRTSVRDAAGLVAQYSAQHGVEHVNICYDAGGWAGTDMARYLAALGIRGCRAYFGGSPVKTRFKTRRAQSAWRLRQRLDPTRPDRPARVEGRGTCRQPAELLIARRQPPFSIPIGPYWGELREELLELRYRHDEAKLRLEDKAEMALRLGRSPDLGDCLIMLASMWPYDE